MPILADGSLALRAIEHYAEQVRVDGGSFPDGWSHVLLWAEAARQLGADPARCDAAKHTKALTIDESSQLLDVMVSGPHMPPRYIIDGMLRMVLALSESVPDIDRATFDERFAGIIVMACDEFYGDPVVRERACRSMRASADILWAAGSHAAAESALGVADMLDNGDQLPHECGLLHASFREVLEPDHVWAYYQSKLQEGQRTPTTS